MIASEKRIFLRRSGVRNARANAESTRSSCGCHVPHPHGCGAQGSAGRRLSRAGTDSDSNSLGRAVAADGSADGRTRACSAVADASPGPEPAPAASATARWPSRRQPRSSPWRSPRTRARVTCSFTPSSPAPSTLTGSPLRTAPLATRSSTVDLAAVREQLGEPVQVDDLVLGAERVLEAPQLGQPHVQRHLAALEAGRHLVAGLGALGAATGGLALGALTATHAGLGGLGARRRAQVVDLECVIRHQSTSSTVTRCDTVKTMPRISGRSSLTTTSSIRLSPSERSVSRWFCLPPIRTGSG